MFSHPRTAKRRPLRGHKRWEVWLRSPIRAAGSENSHRSSHTMRTLWQGWDVPFHTAHQWSSTPEKPFWFSTQFELRCRGTEHLEVKRETSSCPARQSQSQGRPSCTSVKHLRDPNGSSREYLRDQNLPSGFKYTGGLFLCNKNHTGACYIL